jgi:hypothetical protein
MAATDGRWKYVIRRCKNWLRAGLIKEQAKLKTIKKEIIFNYAPIIKESYGVMMQAISVMTKEDEPMESNNERLRDDKSKDVGGESYDDNILKNQSIMQVGGDKEMA